MGTFLLFVGLRDSALNLPSGFYCAASVGNHCPWALFPWLPCWCESPGGLVKHIASRALALDILIPMCWVCSPGTCVFNKYMTFPTIVGQTILFVLCMQKSSLHFSLPLSLFPTSLDNSPSLEDTGTFLDTCFVVRVPSSLLSPKYIVFRDVLLSAALSVPVACSDPSLRLSPTPRLHSLELPGRCSWPGARPGVEFGRQGDAQERLPHPGGFPRCFLPGSPGLYAIVSSSLRPSGEGSGSNTLSSTKASERSYCFLGPETLFKAPSAIICNISGLDFNLGFQYAW